MKFYYYDIIFLALFVILFVAFFFIKRKNWQWEKPFFLYRTKIGLKAIDYIGKKYPRILKTLSYISITTGYLLMAGMVYLLGNLVYVFIYHPEVIRAAKIPPLMPLIPYMPEIFNINFLPPFYFTYWIIAIAIIAISHEFSHGIFARLNKVKVKSTGFGFLGPFLAAFVEPDEKQMQKKSKYAQLSVLSAGSFANVMMTIFFFIIMILFFMVAFAPSGAIFTEYTVSIINLSDIKQINNISIQGFSNSQILGIIRDADTFNSGYVGNLTRIKTNNMTYFVPKDVLRSYYNSTNVSLVGVFDDFPAINSGMKGAIIQINDDKISNYKSLGKLINEYKPGDNAVIKTEFQDVVYEYNITFVKNPRNESQAFLGIGTRIPQGKGFLGKFVSAARFFRDPVTYYKPRFDGNFPIFIDNLLWWIVVINISVALFNMLPLALFDGGRVFYLTLWGIFKSEKIAKKAFTYSTYIIAFAFLLLMILWALSFRKI